MVSGQQDLQEFLHRRLHGMNAFTEFAVSTAKEAGQLLKSRLNTPHTINYKGVINLVTEADRMSETLILERLQKRFPDHSFLTEESPAGDKDPECRWIIDPLDGTTNYAHGYPVFCVSIALERRKRIVTGVVYNPMMDELFFAEEGQGAWLNGQRISVSHISDLSRSLLATGFPYDIRESEFNNLNYFNSLAKQAQAVRRAGSAALDMAYVAAGRFDGFWELKLMPWDTAAASLLIMEAGGIVSDLSGLEFSPGSPHVLASNGKIHRQLIDALQKTP
ncbi:myo-inositol-1(or 4)-monophosphatase [Syntrophus aciditrophicus SB]|uniref:Inositol-1-monophosphatase n=2 Tax=Syntrophus TaxID=43773 RepID=Q2LVM7_SYNAS|nr:myo-inositol-1(or 4)-monophosphatase [Syntrophus aciditrophicus SB]